MIAESYQAGAGAASLESPDNLSIVNIPPMVPHSFRNEGNKLAELVVIFPRNVWEYDVLDHFPFANLRTELVKKGSETR